MQPKIKRHEVVQPEDSYVKLIALTQEQNAIVDAADYEYLMQWNWYAEWNPITRSFYAKRNLPKCKLIPMSNAILGLERGIQVDHISHNTLDNRRCNLRLASPSQNSANRRKRTDNTSGYRGVCWKREHQKWFAQIECRKDGKRMNHHLGYFNTPEEAAIAYNIAAVKIHGEFATLNRLP